MSTLVLLAWLAAAPSRLSGDAYIVAFADSVAAEDVARTASELVGRHGGFLDQVYREERFKGFSARLPPIAASGMRRDPRVRSVEALTVAEPSPMPESKTTAAAPRTPLETPREELPFAPGRRSKLRRVVSPEADRYLVVFADDVRADAYDRIADELAAAHGVTRGPVAQGAFTVRGPESAARALSRDVRVDRVEEQSIAAPAEPRARHEARQLPGQRLRRVAQPMRDHYRLVLRPDVPDDRVEETVAELLRAYEGRRAAPSDDPRVLIVEMSEPSARALSDDLRVELVAEQPIDARAGR